MFDKTSKITSLKLTSIKTYRMKQVYEQLINLKMYMAKQLFQKNKKFSIKLNQDILTSTFKKGQ